MKHSGKNKQRRPVPRRLGEVGEVAAFMTLIAMGVMLVGLVLGAKVGVNRQAAQSLQSSAQEQLSPTPIVSPTPTPIDCTAPGSGCRWFEPDPLGICRAGFTCSADPVIKKLELKAPSGGPYTNNLELGKDKNNRSPIGLQIGGTGCSSKSQGVQVLFDPELKLNARIKRSFNIDNNDVVLTIKNNSYWSDPKRQYGPVNGTHYFVYKRPTWLSGEQDVDFYFEFDATTSGETKTYYRIIKAKGGCTVQTPTPTKEVTPTIAITPTSPPPPPPGSCFSTCETNSDCSQGLTCTNTGEEDRCVSTPDCSPGSAQSCWCGTNPPTTTPTPSPPKQKACSIKSVAYVQQCDDKECTIENARPINESVGKRDLWGVLNDKQIALRPTPKPAAFKLFTRSDRDKVLAETNLPLTGFAYENSDVKFKTKGGKGGTRLPIEPTDSNTTQRHQPNRNNSATANTIDFFTGAVSRLSRTPSSIGYRAGDNAQAVLFFDKNRYQLIKKGIDVCKWNGKGESPADPDKWQCSGKKGTSRLDLTKDVQDEQDRTISGLTLNCNREYQFGWTLQKCSPIDFVLLVDTSTSMADYENASGQKNENSSTSKLQTAIDALKDQFLESVEFGNGDRVALVYFNGADNPEYDGTGGQGLVLQRFTTDKEALKRQIENLQNKVAPGTCIQCGFENVINLIKTSDKSTEYASGQKRVAVVLLTDGNPNYKEKDPRTAESIRIIKKLTDNLKDGEDDLPKTTIATIGYGDPNATDNPGRVFYTNLQNWASKGFCYGTGEVDNKCTKKDNVGEVYVKVASDLNACYAQEQEFAQLLRATDLNGDGIVNSVDFFFVLDLYFARGEAITKGMQEAGLNNSPDINGDEVINSLDLSLVIERIGFTIASK